MGADLLRALASIAKGCGAQTTATELDHRAKDVVDRSGASIEDELSAFDGIIPEALQEPDYLFGRHLIDLDVKNQTAAVAGQKLDLSPQTFADVNQAIEARAIAAGTVPKTTSGKPVPRSTPAPFGTDQTNKPRGIGDSSDVPPGLGQLDMNKVRADVQRFFESDDE
jgi:hypothetical protein